MTRPKTAIREKARALGFDAVGFAAAEADPGDARALEAYVAEGRHGDMDWMARRRAERGSPKALWPDAESVIVLGLNYGPAGDPRALHGRPERGVVSSYARGRDYHLVMKSRMKALARWLAESQDCAVKVFVDTAPVMEKPLARRGGIGWQGKHTNLVSRALGSWLFLGEIFTTLRLPPDRPESDHCGRCRDCIDVCPTGAITAPYRLDARRCISYLTIEHKGHIPEEFRAAIGNRIYGCDDCLAVCPWNKYAALTQEPAFLPRVELTAPKLADLALLDDAAFRRVFSTSPIKRLGRDRFVRNVLIAIGNSGRAALTPAARRLVADESPLVRAMAVWALGRLLSPRDFAALAARHAGAETDPAVAGEWRRSTGGGGLRPGRTAAVRP